VLGVLTVLVQVIGLQKMYLLTFVYHRQTCSGL